MTASDAAPGHARPWARSPRKNSVVGGVALVIGCWGLVALVLVLGAAGNLERAEELSPSARNAAFDLDVDTASAVIDDARAELRDADAGLSNPLVAPFRSSARISAR